MKTRKIIFALLLFNVACWTFYFQEEIRGAIHAGEARATDPELHPSKFRKAKLEVKMGQVVHIDLKELFGLEGDYRTILYKRVTIKGRFDQLSDTEFAIESFKSDQLKFLVTNRIDGSKLVLNADILVSDKYEEYDRKMYEKVYPLKAQGERELPPVVGKM